MGRRKKPVEQRRVKLNMTIHPDIRAWADEISLKRRRSVSQLFEDLVELEWMRQNHASAPSLVQLSPQQQAYYQPQPYPYHYQAQQTCTTPAGT